MRRLNIIILSCFCIFPVYGQKPAGRVLEKPAKYNLPFQDQEISPATEVLPFQSWMVYSDRANNVTFTAPAGGMVKTTASFMEAFYVLEERDDFLRLVKDPAIQGLSLSRKAVDYGWISKENLLLWQHCLVTSKGNLSCKALLSTSSVHSNNAVKATIIFRDQPLPEGKAIIEHPCLPFYFIYKTTATAMLLGEEENFYAQQEGNKPVITGWVANSNIIFWGNAIALEPNWEEKAVAERKKGAPARFFTDFESARNYQRKKKAPRDKVIWENDLLGERPAGTWFRFPIIRVRDAADHNIWLTTGVAGAKTRLINCRNDYSGAGEELSSDGLLTFTMAMAPMKIAGQSEPLFKYVLLLSRYELHNLWASLKKLSEAQNAGDPRHKMHQVWLDLLKTNTNETMDSNFEELHLQKINESVFGLPGNSVLLTKLRLKDILDNRLFPDEKLKEYSESILSKEREVRQIYNQDLKDYPYGFRSNGKPYYWIAADLLP